MKLILSRKGFDSANGGCPSPILPDGTLLSMPIPSKNGNLYYRDLAWNTLTYDEIWKSLAPKAYRSDYRCHLDPDIRENVRLSSVEQWKAAFGQRGTAQRHLSAKGVCAGDVFLFFGWFRQTEYIDGSLAFAEDEPDLNIIYGYMQIGDFLEGDEIGKYHWHPHAYPGREPNRLYLPAERLVIDGEDKGRGYGLFSFDEKYVLTKKNCSRSKWSVPEWFRDVDISYHSADSFKDGYFQSALRGQEFVISDSEHNSAWLKELIGE